MKKLLLLFSLVPVLVKVNAQNVGIGTTTPAAKLDVYSTSGFTSKFNSASNQMYVSFHENNSLRGYIGSYAGAAEDFDIGTGSGNPLGKLHFTIQAGPKMTIDNAGNVGIGTTSPSSSSLLDLNSTTKGMLLPRMTSAQRNDIVYPATGLLVFDTDTKTIWAFDGDNWKNLYNTGGGLILPYSQTVNTAAHAFHITNQGTGAGLAGSSTNEFGIGINASATGGFGWGLNAFTNRPGAVSVRSVADTGMAFYGENIYAGNTNTLMYLLNRGLEKTLRLQLSNSSNTMPNMQISGNNLGEQLKIFQTNAANTTPAVSIDNAGSGEGLKSVAANSGTGVLGISSTGYGVKGESNSSSGFGGVRGDNTGSAGSGVIGVSNAANTQGVYGTSTNGIGVRAFSNTYRGLQGTSASGTGVYASSTSGLALETIGNIKISGGNTNPADGAILTSDANGNAVWKKNKIAFKTEHVAVDYYVIPSESEWKLMFSTELYDYGNNFEPYTGGVPGANDATFIAPVNGLYHFDIKIGFEGAIYPNEIEDTYIILRRQRGASITDLAKSHGSVIYNWSLIDHADYNISTDVQLQAGDKLWVILWHDSDLGGDGKLQVYETFSGHLIFEH